MNAKIGRSTTDVEAKLAELRLNLSRAVRTAREVKGWTQKQLARAIRSSQPRVAKIEAGSSDVTLDLMLKALFTVGGQWPVELPEAKPAVKRKAKAKFTV
ncbi:Helix-turn-helix [Singulisphaera sp. GP187]|uniref:helix-turn-helix domain-containing protein n=1 Tax=Singulisphaera sp. GP187 TaxID=1882752 RepID=UPI00092CB9C4|nr:helix-turn-helix transcriptional regulator [Singulisphaera sp. GP187]SIO64917.1 Helix-turn-helix [Singulisphaera sp. GP187]